MAARITAYLVAFIVGTTFIAGLIVGAQREDGPVDLIVVNGSVYTADGHGTMAEAVAVQGNKILMVGSNREVQRLRRPQTVVVDAHGGAVLPGFTDTHVQLIEAGLTRTEVDLTDATTRVAVESIIKGWAAMHPERDWVTGRGWVLDAFAGELPTRQQLDALVPDRPVFLVADDGESGWANSTALRRAQITRRTANPPGGAIVKDPRSGEPTGLLKGAAMELVAECIPPPTHAELTAAVRAAIDDAHRRGVTSVQHEGSEADLALLDDLRRAKELDVRVYATVTGRTDWTTDDFERLERLRAQFDDDPLLKAGAVRLIVSEAVDADSLAEAAAALDARGWQVIFETIGEEAVRLALAAIERAIGDNDEPAKGRRHRLDPSGDLEIDAARAARLEVLLDRQPDSAGAGRLDDPILGFQVLIVADDSDSVGRRERPERERLTLAQAVDAYTRDAAWGSFDEHRKGTLARDMLADLVILSHDIFSLPPQRVAEADVTVTIFDGKIVYTRSTESDD